MPIVFDPWFMAGPPGMAPRPRCRPAYSAIVRSLENLPECPTLMIARRAQASGCR